MVGNTRSTLLYASDGLLGEGRAGQSIWEISYLRYMYHQSKTKFGKSHNLLTQITNPKLYYASLIPQVYVSLIKTKLYHQSIFMAGLNVYIFIYNAVYIANPKLNA